MSLGWIFGITSAHYQESGLIITFLLVHFVLAVVILALRAIWDDQVSKFACCFKYIAKLKACKK